MKNQAQWLWPFSILSGLLLCGSLGGGIAQAESYFDSYPLQVASPSLDLGVQPLGYPSGVISAVMQRDRILKGELAKLGHPLTSYGFWRGADMVAMIKDGRLEAGLLGDMPTIMAASEGEVWIAGLVKKTSTSIVAKGEIQVQRLKGRRIGYVDSSSAHHTLLQGLASVGLNDRDVQLIAMSIDAMPDALERGEIDAFAAWEPAPAIALARSEANRIVFRGLSSDYFVINRRFAQNYPEAALHLLAGFVRAIEWMRRSTANIETAAVWAINDGRALAGKPSAVTVSQVVNITRREILNVPSAPTIVFDTQGKPPLASEFQFLKQLGKVPAAGSGEQVAAAFAYPGLAQVMTEQRRYRIKSFDYESADQPAP